MVREFDVDMYTWLNLKWITNKDLLYNTGNSIRCYVAAWMGGEFGGEWMHRYVWLSPFAVHLKLSQHCQSAIPQYKIKSLKNKKGIYRCISNGTQLSHKTDPAINEGPHGLSERSQKEKDKSRVISLTCGISNKQNKHRDTEDRTKPAGVGGGQLRAGAWRPHSWWQGAAEHTEVKVPRGTGETYML